MKKLSLNLMVASFIFSFPLATLATNGTPKIKKAAASINNKAKDAATTKDKKEETEKKATNAALLEILNQLALAKLDFDVDLSMKVTEKDGESTTDIDFKYLNLSMLVKFKDKLLYSFVEEEKVDNQLKKIVPSITFSTDDMFVVSKVQSAKKGKMKLTVRFCQSYSSNNDFCNTHSDSKLLDVSVKSPNFGMFDMRIKEINVNFEPKLADGKVSFSGSCTAWKSAFDMETPDKTLMKPATCQFDGVYDSKATIKFDGNFKLRSKK